MNLGKKQSLLSVVYWDDDDDDVDDKDFKDVLAQ